MPPNRHPIARRSPGRRVLALPLEYLGALHAGVVFDAPSAGGGSHHRRPERRDTGELDALRHPER